jgi:transposase
MAHNKIEMDVVNPKCAGIDVGSKSHFIAIGQNLEDVKEFGVYAEDLTSVCKHLKDHGITSVALESTGNYWQNLYVELMRFGFDVTLCNGKFTKNIKGKKTDVKDCRWIQKLHTLGLLTGSFLPDETTEQLRTYCRQRANLIDLAAEATNKMQKYLRLLNCRLDIVVRDICGQTGLAIIADICKGNLDPDKLAEHRNYKCRKSKEEIAKALIGNNRPDFLFGLKQEYESYMFYQKKIDECDKEITKFLNTQINTCPEKKKLKAEGKPYKRVTKNAVRGLDLNQASFQYFGGIDLLKIEGVSYATLLTIMSELGPGGFTCFETGKQFTSWMRLAPNNKISGGRILSHKVPKGSNRLKIAFRQAANSIGNLKDTHLSDFFRRVSYRKGHQAAVSATARKLAVIVWNMVTKKVQYSPPIEYMFLDEKRKLKLVQRIRKNIAKFDIKPDEVGFATT